MWFGQLRVGIKPFGLPGHQLIGGGWNSQTYTSLTQDLRTQIPFEQIVRGEISLRDALSEVQIRKTSGSWAAYYNFEGAALGRVAMRAKLVTSGKADVSSPIRCLADSPARWARDQA